MHVGIQAPFLLPYVTPAFIADAARASEDAGFQTIWAPEHVVLFDDYDSTYPYTPNGKLRGPGSFDLVAMLPNPAIELSFADDLRQSMVTTSDWRSDVWLARVEAP